jgi:hypothetical protein
MDYNLPPDKYLKQGFIFLALVILGTKLPKKQMNIFLCLMMKELKELWQGVDAYVIHMKYWFNLGVTYLWSIHDYLACGKFVGWCVHDRLNCQLCMDDSDAFRLEHGRKVTLFDYHWMFLLLNHPFRSDKRSFLKSKSVRKGPPKRKLRANMTKMLHDLKQLENSEFKGYDENHN